MRKIPPENAYFMNSTSSYVLIRDAPYKGVISSS